MNILYFTKGGVRLLLIAVCYDFLLVVNFQTKIIFGGCKLPMDYLRIKPNGVNGLLYEKKILSLNILLVFDVSGCCKVIGGIYHLIPFKLKDSDEGIFRLSTV